MNIIELLAFFGGMCLISFVILVMLLLFNFIKEFVENIKWEYKKKHRFNKPPIAKCYCKDCIYYNGKNKYGKCIYGHIDSRWNIADSWFCWNASPYRTDPDKEKKVL